MLRVGIVGPCGSGKTTLINQLRLNGQDFDIRHIAQEHSYVPDMWLRIVHPDVLIFLEVSFEIATSRRKLNWSQAEFTEQLRRLQNARENADLVIPTDELTPEQIADCAIRFLRQSSGKNGR